jgi:hypothetical protein
MKFTTIAGAWIVALAVGGGWLFVSNSRPSIASSNQPPVTASPAQPPVPVPQTQAAAVVSQAQPPVAIPQVTEPQSVLPAPRQTPPNDVPEYVQGACMSKVQGLIGNRTTVNGMSVAYHHSVDSRDLIPPINPAISPEMNAAIQRIARANQSRNNNLHLNFYIVTVDAEIMGRRFSSQYLCRETNGGLVEIMRG